MSLRWFSRRDLYQRGDEQFSIKICREKGVGVSLSADVLWFDDDGILCSQSCFDTQFFDSMSACEFFLSRKKKAYEIKKEGLISRTYSFDFLG